MKRIVDLKLMAALVFLGLIIAAEVSAQQNDPYYSEVVIFEQNEVELQKAYWLSLSKVFVGVSGGQAILSREPVQEALGSAESFVEQFSLRRLGLDEQTSETLITKKASSVSSDDATDLLVVSIRFSEEAVDEVLASVGETLPSSNIITDLPSTMMWVVFQNAGAQGTIIGGDNHFEQQMYMSQLAAENSLELIFPVMDLQDRQAINNADIRGGFQQRMLDAAVRYDAGVVVGGIVRQQDGLWVGGWQRYVGAQRKIYTYTSNELDDVLENAVQWMASLAMAEANVQSGGFESVSSSRIWVGRVDSADRYAKVMRLLSDLPLVEAVTPEFLSSQGAIFSISPRLSIQELAENLSVAPWLRRSAAPEQNSPEQDSVLFHEMPGAELYYDFAG